MTDRLLTPSKITAWLDCAHFLTLFTGTAVPDRSDGRSGLFEQAGPSPLFETGRAVFVVFLEELGRRHPKVSHNLKSGRVS